MYERLLGPGLSQGRSALIITCKSEKYNEERCSERWSVIGAFQAPVASTQRMAANRSIKAAIKAKAALRRGSRERVGGGVEEDLRGAGVWFLCKLR